MYHFIAKSKHHARHICAKINRSLRTKIVTFEKSGKFWWIKTHPNAHKKVNGTNTFDRTMPEVELARLIQGVAIGMGNSWRHQVVTLPRGFVVTLPRGFSHPDGDGDGDGGAVSCHWNP